MAINVVISKAHNSMLNHPQVKAEMEFISNGLNNADFNFAENAVNFVFVNGSYDNTEKKMDTVCLFVNKTNKSIKELHGVIDISFKAVDAEIALTTVNFDEAFLGELNHDEALLVHFNIPVRGLNDNRTFKYSDIEGQFKDVRVTYK